MKIKSCSFNIFFPVMQDIRRYIFTFEDVFEGFVKPFNLLPIPEGAPAELPRITSVSQHGHTHLNITLQNIQMVTEFEDNFASSPEKCFNYIENELNQVMIGIKNSIGEDKILFSGLTTQVEFDGEKNCGKKLSDKFMNIKTAMNVMDVNSRVTFAHDEKYYVNVGIENTRTYIGEKKENSLSIAGLTQIGEGIQVTLDVNDRLAFNKDETYRTSERDIRFIFEFSKQMINESLDEFVKSGEL